MLDVPGGGRVPEHCLVSLNAGHRGEPKHLRLRELPGELDLPGTAAFGGGRLLPETAKLESVECSGTLVRALGTFEQR